jgi:matrixin
MTASPTRIHRRLAAALAGLGAAVALSLSAPGNAQALQYSAEVFPNLYGAGSVGLTAWNGYLNHCSYVYYYAYTDAEIPEHADAYAFAPLGGCEIYFNADSREMYRYAWFCSVLVHEMGHSAGLNHIGDPRDIMHATNEVYWRNCLTARQAKRFRRRGEIIDNSIWSTWYSRTAALKGETASAEQEPTQAEIDAAIADGSLEVEPIGRMAVR